MYCLFDRTGIVRAGDVIAAINGNSCDYVTLNEAVSMLRRTGDVVHLKLKKDGNYISNIHLIVPLLL